MNGRLLKVVAADLIPRCHSTTMNAVVLAMIVAKRVVALRTEFHFAVYVHTAAEHRAASTIAVIINLALTLQTADIRLFPAVLAALTAAQNELTKAKLGAAFNKQKKSRVALGANTQILKPCRIIV